MMSETIDRRRVSLSRARRFVGVLLLLLLVSAGGECRAFGTPKTDEEYRQSVRELFAAGKWSDGMVILEEGLKRYPESSELNELAGSYYYNLKNYDNARYYLVRAVKNAPDNVTAKSLLINVEEQTGNYSSAICYVNELLEVTPYWPGLWKRKIGLYRLQGDDAEADRLLKRLYDIYPNDTAVRRDYVSRLEENYLRQRKAGQKQEAIDNLQKLLEMSPRTEVYYLDLANLLLQLGDPEAALRVVARGVETTLCAGSLITKQAEILAARQRYAEALAFLEMKMDSCSDPSLRRLHTSLLNEYGAAQRNADPYRIYGKLYEMDRDKATLDYLLNEAMASGREEDVRKYLAEARASYGPTSEYLYKEYTFYKRMGSPRATQLLDSLYRIDPQNEEIVEDLCAVRYAQGDAYLSDEAYREAAQRFDFVASVSPDPELRLAALRKSYSANLLMKRYGQAAQRLDELKKYIEPDEFTVRRTEVMGLRGDTVAALRTLYEYLQLSNEVADRDYVAGAYEELAVPYVKGLIEVGNREGACREAARLVQVAPRSEAGLRYAVTAFSEAGRMAEADDYIRRGLETFPGNTYFVEKQAASLYAAGRYAEAIDRLRPAVDSLPGNRGLVAALSASSDALAEAQLKSMEYDSAMQTVERALGYDARNRALLYAKGRVYEKRGEYDSAYLYQSRYQPEASEARTFRRHLMGLQQRSMNNELSMGLMLGQYVNGKAYAPVVDLSYSYIGRRDRYFIAPAYTARERVNDTELGIDVPGGQAVQLVAGWERRFSKRWSSLVSLGWSNAYFPALSANLAVTYAFDREWTLGLNLAYRSLNNERIDYQWIETTDPATGTVAGQWQPSGYAVYKENLMSVGLLATKYYETLVLALRGYLFLRNSNFYFNGSAQLKYFPLGDRTTFVSAMVGVGTAPELDVIDYAMPGSFAKLNVMAGVGAGYLVGKNMLVGLSVTYHTLYTQNGNRVGGIDDYTYKITTGYKNMFNIYPYIAFYF